MDDTFYEIEEALDNLIDVTGFEGDVELAKNKVMAVILGVKEKELYIKPPSNLSIEDINFILKSYKENRNLSESIKSLLNIRLEKESKKRVKESLIDRSNRKANQERLYLADFEKIKKHFDRNNKTYFEYIDYR